MIDVMFSYYGSKSKIVDYYPYPKYDKIIEPFAGSARYSLKHFEKDILLIDKYEMIVRIWHYLQNASELDILNLPDVNKGEDLRTFSTLTKTEKNLIGLNIARGNFCPINKAQQFNNWNSDKKWIAKNLYKIRHWVIKQDDYQNLSNEEATWFIDPPYFIGGYKYIHSEIDYDKLGEWCKSRMGQVIVCENSKARWLPFKPMIKFSGAFGKSVEAIWSNLPMNYDNEQLTMELK